MGTHSAKFTLSPNRIVNQCELIAVHTHIPTLEA